MVHKNPLVFVNYYAPWCYWSNKLAPDWYAPELTRAPRVSVLCVPATRTSLPRTVRTGGAGRLVPRAHVLYVRGTRTSLGRTAPSACRGYHPGKKTLKELEEVSQSVSKLVSSCR